MKKICYILLFPLLWGCDNVLDVEPENAITFTNFFKTEADFNASLFQLQSYFQYKVFENEAISQRACIADKTIFQDQRNLNQSAILKSFTCDWRNQYDLIYAGNVILDNLHRAEGISKKMLDFYAGQAYFVKGFVYFDLARKWGDAVITKNSTSMQVYGKSSAVQVVDEAIRDAEEGFKLLPTYENLPRVENNTWVSKQYGCKGTCAALLAHAYAWKGSMIELCGWEGDAQKCYDKSIEWSSLLIDKKVGIYELESTQRDVCVKAMKGMGTSQESILEFELDEFQNYPHVYILGSMGLTWPVKKTETPGSVLRTSLMIKATTVKALYDKTDLRRDEYFYRLDSMSHDTMYKVNEGYAYIYKWRESVYKDVSWSPMPQFAYLYANCCYWRLADIYLLRAECYAKLKNPLAENDLKKIRERAHAMPYPAPGENDIQAAIFKERERELLWEGHRYYDIVRNGIDYIHSRLEGNFKTLTEQEIKDGALYLPVNRAAFTLNDLMRQTLYWAKYE